MDNLYNIPQIRDFLEKQSDIKLVWVFGSVAKGDAGFDSDIDIAITTNNQLTADRKAELISGIALIASRPVDLIDLNAADPVLMRQVLRKGKIIINKDSRFLAEMIKKYLFAMTDWQPYRERILSERRRAWISS